MHVERDPHRPDPPPGVAHRDGPSSFAQLVGYTAQTLTRTAVAEYEQPVAMGSPSNVLGNEPIGPLDVAAWSNDATHTPNLWANVKGPQSTKGTGDSTAAYQCGGLGALQNCANNVQADYSNAGYFYKVQVDRKAHPGQHLVIQVYDPAAIDVGDHCDHNNIQNAATKVNPHTNAADALVRYAWGDTSNNPVPGSGAFCSGDYNDEDVGHPPTTTYLVRRDLNPYAETTNPPVPVGTCAGTQFTGFHGDVAAALDGSAGTYNDTVASNFRQWKPICSFIPDQYPSSDYLIQVRTNIADGPARRPWPAPVTRRSTPADRTASRSGPRG